MKVLIVNAFQKNFKQFEHFKEAIIRVFKKLRKNPCIQPDLQYANNSTIVDYLYDPNNHYISSTAQKLFDSLDLIFLAGDPNQLPWLKKQKKITIFIKMCKRANKCLFTSGQGFLTLVTLCSTPYQITKVVNNQGHGSNLQAIQQETFELPLQIGQVILDNSTGDFYTYNQELNEIVPTGNIGIHNHKSAQDSKMSEIMYSKRHINNDNCDQVKGSQETKCWVLKRYLNHWLTKGLQNKQWVVQNSYAWDAHPVLYTEKQRQFQVIAETQRGFSLILLNNIAATIFLVDPIHKFTEILLENYINRMTQLIIDKGERLDIPISQVSYCIMPQRMTKIRKEIPINQSYGSEYRLVQRLPYSGASVSNRTSVKYIVQNNSTTTESIQLKKSYQDRQSLLTPDTSVRSRSWLKTGGSYDRESSVQVLRKLHGLNRNTQILAVSQTSSTYQTEQRTIESRSSRPKSALQSPNKIYNQKQKNRTSINSTGPTLRSQTPYIEQRIIERNYERSRKKKWINNKNFCTVVKSRRSVLFSSQTQPNPTVQHQFRSQNPQKWLSGQFKTAPYTTYYNQLLRSINMARFRTPFCGYAVEFSPFEQNKLAVATAQHFGVVGNGALHVLRLDNNILQEVYSSKTQDGIFDLSWNEGNENQLLCSSGDGSVKLFDLAYPQPLQIFAEHTAEVYGVDCNFQQHNLFSSASFDNTIKIWDMQSPNSILTFTEHTGCVYETSWNPKNSQLLLSASGDSTAKIWDIRQPTAIQTAAGHGNEVLSVDWDKYNDGFVTSSVDQSLALWDMRSLQRPYLFLTGHTYAIRRVRYSPYDSTILASASYDMTICIWNTNMAGAPAFKHEHHSEFVIGVDFSIFEEKQIASCGWDGKVAVWEYDAPAP